VNTKTSISNSRLADIYISILLAANCVYTYFNVVDADVLPLSDLIVPTALYFAFNAAIIGMILSGFFNVKAKTGLNAVTPMSPTFRVTVLSAAIIGGTVFVSDSIERLAEQAELSKKQFAIAVCVARISFSFATDAQAQAWCEVDKNRINLSKV